MSNIAKIQRQNKIYKYRSKLQISKIEDLEAEVNRLKLELSILTEKQEVIIVNPTVTPKLATKTAMKKSLDKYAGDLGIKLDRRKSLRSMQIEFSDILEQLSVKL